MTKGRFYALYALVALVYLGVILIAIGVRIFSH